MKFKYNADIYHRYFTPTNKSRKLKPRSVKISDELWDKIREKQFEKLGPASTQWIFLIDAIERGSITPFEGYDCLNLGYIPEHLSTRESLYIY
jgi:hypothetical protein